MVRLIRVLLTLTFIAAVISLPLTAQEYDENSHLNTHLAFPVSVPVGSTSQFVQWGTGVTGGAGYNFNKNNAFVGELMWNWLYPTDQSLSPLRDALAAGGLNGHSNFFAFTANYKFEMRGRKFGGYIIGGPGLYYRNASLSAQVTPAAGTPCTNAWLWWGFDCAGGVVLVKSHSTFDSSALGGNAGAGFTIKVGPEPRYRLFFEARYHYAPLTNFPVRMIPITTGIRF